jgi:hypothetical protein
LLCIFLAIINVFESDIFQTRVPNELKGRDFAAEFALCDGLQPISLAAIGGLLALVSAPAVLIGAGIAVVAMTLVSAALKDVREL